MNTEMMNTELSRSKNCADCRKHLPDLLLDSSYASDHPQVAAHLAACAPCSAELTELRSTYSLLDEFAAPEPSPFFDTRLRARLREAQAEEPEGFWERMRSYLAFSTGRSFRPLLAGAMALVLVAGGASVLGVRHFAPDTPVTASSAVDDLKVLDNNEPAEQQMGQLLDQSGAEDEDAQSSS